MKKKKLWGFVVIVLKISNWKQKQGLYVFEQLALGIWMRDNHISNLMETGYILVTFGRGTCSGKQKMMEERGESTEWSWPGGNQSLIGAELSMLCEVKISAKPEITGSLYPLLKCGLQLFPEPCWVTAQMFQNFILLLCEALVLWPQGTTIIYEPGRGQAAFSPCL